MTSAFRSLQNPNYRLWAAGALVSNVGTWMQRTAQDWLVLVQLTHNNAASMGVVMALQFGPQVLLLPVTGYVADRFELRKILILTQTLMGVLALGLGILTITGWVQLWHVYCFAGALGCVTAFDAPARQSFVSELVGDSHVSNAVALNSTSFNSARMLGPAIAGVLIADVGTGWVFLINSMSFAGVLISLYLIKRGLLNRPVEKKPKPGSIMDGFRYVQKRADIITILVMMFFIGTFCFNFAIFISTMSVKVFHAGARQFGLLTSMMAIGSVIGALLAAKRDKPNEKLLYAGGLILGSGFAIASVMPNFWLFGLMLLIIGATAQTITTSANSYVQLATEKPMRGRVVAIYLAIFIGGTPLGAPFVGWAADTFGPRQALWIGAAAGFIAAAIGINYLLNKKKLGVPPIAMNSLDTTQVNAVHLPIAANQSPELETQPASLETHSADGPVQLTASQITPSPSESSENSQPTIVPVELDEQK